MSAPVQWATHQQLSVETQPMKEDGIRYFEGPDLQSNPI